MPRVPFDPATDYYKILGVDAGAPVEAIQAAYRKLAKAFHPDLNDGSTKAAERMARLNAAKSVLLDPQTREIYDQLRASRMARPMIRPDAGPPRAARPANGGPARPAGPNGRPVHQGGPAGGGPVHQGGAVGGPARHAEPATAYVPTDDPFATTAGRTVDGFSVRYAPFQATARARHRVVSNAATRAERGRAFDRGTGVLLLVALPLIAALCLYLFQAFQLSIEPLKTASSDVLLSPGQNYRPTTRGAADAVFMMVNAQPPSRDLAVRANNFILARSDSTPESEELRADGRRLVRSATDGDNASWDATVNHICQLAGRC